MSGADGLGWAGAAGRTARRSGGQHNTDTWAVTNKASGAADTSRSVGPVPACVYVSLPFGSRQTDESGVTFDILGSIMMDLLTAILHMLNTYVDWGIRGGVFAL